MGAALKLPPLKSTAQEHTPAKELGGILRDSRIASEQELATIGQETNIAVEHLKALESGDWSQLPGEVYARGYLKKYAEHLGFDPDEFIGRLKPAPATIEPIVTPVLKHYHAPINLRPYIVWGVIILVSFLIGAYVATTKTKPRHSHVKPIPASLQHYLKAEPLTPFYRHSCLEQSSNIWGCYFSHYTYSLNEKGILY